MSALSDRPEGQDVLAAKAMFLYRMANTSGAKMMMNKAIQVNALGINVKRYQAILRTKANSKVNVLILLSYLWGLGGLRSTRSHHKSRLPRVSQNPVTRKTWKANFHDLFSLEQTIYHRILPKCASDLPKC